MKSWLFAGAALLLAAGALAPAAQAEGPRASSESTWPGMRNPPAAVQAPAGAEPQYVWQEGYEHGGRWHGHWVLVR